MIQLLLKECQAIIHDSEIPLKKEFLSLNAKLISVGEYRNSFSACSP